jgi:hypothetical protein
MATSTIARYLALSKKASRGLPGWAAAAAVAPAGREGRPDD